MPRPLPPSPLLFLLVALPLGGGCMDYWLWDLQYASSQQSWGDFWDDSHGLSGSCWETFQPPFDMAINEDCALVPELGTIDAEVDWSVDVWQEYPEYNEVLMTPVVGQLTDDNGDGLYGPGDMPDIVMVADINGGDGDSGAVRIISGDGSRVHLTLRRVEIEDEGELRFNRYSNAALGDINGDGIPEIVITGIWQGSGGDPGDPILPDTAPLETGMDSGGGGPVGPCPWAEACPPAPPAKDGEEPGGNCVPVALDASGNIVWIGVDAMMPCSGHSPALADLEGDGTVEVVVGNAVLEGADGSLRFLGEGGKGYYQAYEQIGAQSFPIDLDLDGVQEVVTGTTLYAPDGSILCQVDEDLTDGFPAAADLDGDGLGEFVVIGDGHARVHEHDCSLTAEWELEGSGNGGPPTIADFDGDGVPEIGVANATYYAVYEATGEVLWTMPVTDASSHATGSTVFDFDRDGRSEVVYADETTLWVFAGPDGQVRLQWDTHTSRTLHEYPVVVDVDGDGMTEIVVPNGGGHYGTEYRGLYVLGSANDDWGPNRQVWNQHAYNIVNINDDMSIPSHPDANWPGFNNFRSGYVQVPTGGRLPDAAPMTWEICRHKCRDGLVGILVALGNGGVADMDPGIPIGLYTESAGARLWLDTAYTSGTIASGHTESLYVQLHEVDIVDGVVILVMDDRVEDGIYECNEANNELRLEGVTCP